MKLNDIFLVILVLVILYLIYKNIYCKNISDNIYKKENFITETEINDMINNKFSVDITTINELSDLIDEISLGQSPLNIESNTLRVKDIIINGSIYYKQKDNILLNIFQRYMVIAWNETVPPSGWALCDGKTYSLNENGIAVESFGGILTPDLRGRFALGSGKDNNNNLIPRNFNDKGGEETHTLTIEEMPTHEHNLHIYGRLFNCGRYATCSMPSVYSPYTTFNLNTLSNSDSVAFADYNRKTSTNGESKPHNNMPPFYVLTYIMKL